MRRHGIVTLIVLLLAFSTSASSASFRTGRSSRGTAMGQLKAPAAGRLSNEAEAPPVYAGALIRTAGAGWKVSAGSPQQHQFVEGGGFIGPGAGGHYINFHPGLQIGPKDNLPAPAFGATASGRNAITPNGDISPDGAGNPSGPPFPGGASGHVPPNK